MSTPTTEPTVETAAPPTVPNVPHPVLCIGEIQTDCILEERCIDGTTEWTIIPCESDDDIIEMVVDLSAPTPGCCEMTEAVATPGPPITLPETGAGTDVQLGIASLLVLLGLAAVRWSR